MNGVIAWFARNPVAANLTMLMIVVSGFLATASIGQEIFPEMALDMVTVNVTYLGASPTEVEEAVSVRLEEAIQGLDGIKQVTSTASEGVASLVVELELGADLRKAVDDIKGGVDAIDTFPAEVERPIIREITTKFQVTHVAVWGDVDELSLRRWADTVRDELSSLPGVSQVELLGARPYEISIEVSETALRRHGLTFDRVADAVRGASLDLPGGSVRTDAGEILLRTVGQVYEGTEFESLALLTSADGTYVRLGDVATVVDGFAETDQAARFNGVPAIVLQVFRSNQVNAPEVAANVNEYVERAPTFLPPGVSLTVWQDQATLLEHRLGLMVRNGLTGSALVFVFLAVFLRPRLAFWVGLGIPISFLGALMLMPSLDLSLNMMTLFGFLVVLGIVVDDAIIVGENIYTHQERHGDRLRGAIEGAQEVVVPVTFGVLTTVAAFLPIMLVQGMMGKFFAAVPMVVMCCLGFSLVESTLILPAHLAHSGRRHAARRSGAKSGSGRRMRWFTNTVYGRVLDASIRWRYLTVAGGTAILLLTVGALLSGRVPFEFFAAPESDYVTADVALAPGAPIQMTQDVVARIEAGANQLATQYRERSSGARVRHVYAAVGEQPFGSAQAEAMMSGGIAVGASHVGEVTIEIESGPNRTLSGDEIAAQWRDLIGPLPGVEDLSFLASSFSPGMDLDIQLTGSDLPTLESAAVEVQNHLERYPGVYDVNDSARPGKQELRMRIKPAATLLGLSQRDLGRQVRQAFYGEEVQRIQRGRHDVRVMVRYPREGRQSIGDVDRMRIRTPDGADVPFTSVAEVETGRGFSIIRRVDRQRAVNVTAAVGADTSTGSVVSDLEAAVLPEILATHPGVAYSLAGMLAEQADSMEGLAQGFLFALLLIYTLLAIPLKSYIQPLIIMAAIPFGLVGAFWGHVIMGVPLTLISLFGLVALAGVVVNDSLLMIDFINRKRLAHADVTAAAREAGVARFRPILLTSLTTFAGLLPIILDNDIQARSLVPMAISLAFGVVFATVITLVLVPAGYVIVEDLRRLLTRRPQTTDRQFATP
ncbi:MAG: efflux RND transporter permease subunit [bacterium]